jgi:hypothetical protein
MPVNTAHPQYDLAKPKWKRIRDVVAGTDSVHAAGEAYLPKLKDQTAQEYQAYVRRATWYGATARTLEAMHGLVFRKPAVITGPQDLLEDLTMTGKSAADVASEAARHVLEVARVGVMVDFAKVDGIEVSNAAQAAAKGLRSYASLYAAESMINWREERINGTMQLSLMVLQEAYEKDAEEGAVDDLFKRETATQYRVLLLDAETGNYTQRVYREGANGWYIHSQTVPLMRGIPMKSIPFFVITNEHIGAEVTDPPVIDLVDMNLSHYRTSADLEQGAHITAIPTPWVAGYQKVDEKETFKMGSTSAWVFADPNVKVDFLEFNGHGLQTIEKIMDRKEMMMAKLGARMLMDQKGGVESAQALEIKSSGETSVLGAVAVLVGRAMTKVLEIAAEWNGSSEKCACELNTEFVLTSMDPAKISALVSAWQAGAISHKTLFWNLKQGEAVADSVDFEEEKADIENDGPNLTATMVTAPAAKSKAAPAPEKA